MQIALGWSFFDMAGSSVGTFLPQPSGGGNGPPVYTTSSIELRFVLTASGWQIDTTDFQDSPLLGFVSSQLANQFCSDSADVTTAWVEQATGKVGGYGLPLRPLLDGCFFTTNSNGGSDPQQIDPLTDTQSTWYLEHFGALLAVNDMAHAMFPQLPRATAEEVHTLRQSETSAP